jgi:hypothetical protein
MVNDHLAASELYTPQASDFLNRIASEIETDCRPKLRQPDTGDKKNFSFTTFLIILEAVVSLAVNCGLIKSNPAKVIEIAARPSRYYRLIVRGHVFAATLKRGGWRTEDVGAIVEGIFKRASGVTIEDLKKLHTDAVTYRQT